MLRSRDQTRGLEPACSATYVLAIMIKPPSSLRHLPQGTRERCGAPSIAPETPVHLKALMLLVPAYLLEPDRPDPRRDPALGWVDDFVIMPLLVSWIVGMP